MSDQKMSGYDSVNRNVFESSAEGRQRWCRRNLLWQAVPHLRASKWICSAASSGVVNWRLNEAFAAGRAKSSATWKVGNISERAKVRRCTAMEDLLYQDGNCGPDVLRNTQSVKAGECVRDMVGATQVENQPPGCVEDRLPIEAPLP